VIVSFDDVFVADNDALLGRLVHDLTTAPGVVDVLREDREVILIAPQPGGEVEAVRAWVAEWLAAPSPADRR